MTNTARLCVLVMCIVSSSQAIAQDAQINKEFDFQKESFSDVRNDLYLFCQDEARRTSGYLGYVPGEYVETNALDDSFNLNRQGGLYDIKLDGFGKQPRKAGTIGGKLVLSFGPARSSSAEKKKRQQRRDFRKGLNGCLLSKR